MSELIATWIPALASALLAFVWQGALVGVAALAALHALRGARPQLRYLVACAALLLCLALPVIGVAMALAPAALDGAVATATGSMHASLAADGLRAFAGTRLPAPTPDVLAWTVALWASGTLLLSLRLAAGLAWVRGACRDARPEDGSLQACIARLSSSMGIGRHVSLRLCADGDGPVVAGWWTPVVLLPVAMAARVPAPLLEALLAHELAHVRRHDYLVNLLQGVVEALLFYHPVVWWLSHRIRIERELVADDLAATALGDRRRLAQALAALDQWQAQRAPAPHSFPPHLAPAAHGGHLMSRIRQLVRPDRHIPRAAAALPLLVLIVAGAGAYAHARSERADPPASPNALPANAPRGAIAPLPAPQPVAGALRGALQVAARGAGHDGPSYALVQDGNTGIVMSGSVDDIEAIRATSRGKDDEYLWFRRDGRAWVVRDAGILARAREARREDEVLESQMRALSDQMRPHSERMEAMGEQMSALSEDMQRGSPAVEAASDRMSELSDRMAALGERQAALGERMARASETQRPALEAQMDALGQEQDALSSQMDQQAQAIDQATAGMETHQAPMEELGRRMEAEGKPMEAIGKQMEALGTRIEAQAKRSSAAIARLIDDAQARGLAEPASSRQ